MNFTDSDPAAIFTYILCPGVKIHVAGIASADGHPAGAGS